MLGSSDQDIMCRSLIEFNNNLNILTFMRPIQKVGLIFDFGCTNYSINYHISCDKDF